MIQRRCYSALGILVLSLGPSASALALKQDREQPLRVSAASADMNEQTGIAVYRGKVVLTQGSLRIEADRLEVRTHNRRPETITATGRPVRLRTLLDNSEEELKASAARLVYHAEAREVELIGDAAMNQGGDQFDAEYFQYAIDAKRLTANGTDTKTGRTYGKFRTPPAKDAP